MDIIDKLPTVKRLIRQLNQVPFLASKNLYRVVSHFLQLDKDKALQFCKALQDVQEQVSLCSICFVWQEKNEHCLFCLDQSRDKSVVCVVESWQDLLVLERTDSYRGLYHVLGGVICPLDGVGPADLHIEALIDRIQDPIKEVILAMNYTPEGEATSAFIARKLQGKNIKVSSLAKGVPIGSNLEFIDRLTVGKALADRKPF